MCPGVDIIASIAQYSTEIFPMTGPAPGPGLPWSPSSPSAPSLVDLAQIQPSYWLLSSRKVFSSCHNPKKRHKMLQMSNEFV